MNNTALSGNKKQELGGGCLMLFALPFSIAGLIALSLGLGMLKTYFQSKNWLKVPAQIKKVKLKESRGSKGKRLYKLEGKYTYQIEGKNYVGNRILLENGSSSNYHEKKDLYNKLRKAKKKKESFPIFVDPANHESSLVFRVITTGVILLTGMGGVFSSIGLAMFFAGLFQKLKKSRQEKILRLNPNKPWVADSRWNGFSIATNNRTQLFWSWVLGICLPMFVSIFVVLLFKDKNAPVFAWLIVGLFSMFALALFVHAIYKTIQHLKYGESFAVLNQIPLRPGDEARMAVLIPARFSDGQIIDVEIFCEKKTTTGSGKNSTTHTDKLHKKSFQLAVSSSNQSKNRIALPVELQIPDTARPDSIDTNPSFQWKLVLKADVPGVDYEAEFPLPVFEVKDETLIQRKFE